MIQNIKYRLFEMMEKLNPDFKSELLKFIIPVGISGSGKSSWINMFKGQNFVVVSPDEIRKELTGDISDMSRNSEVFPLAYRRAANALNGKKNVIFDATNVVSYLRKDLLKYLKENVHENFIAQAKIFNIDPEISKERIRKDIESGVDRSNVPPEVIDKQYQKFITDLDKIESDGYEIIN